MMQQLTAGRADVSVVFRFVGETLGTEVWTPLPVNALAGPHIRCDVAILQPLQELPIAVGRIGGHRLRCTLTSGGIEGQNAAQNLKHDILH